LYDFTHWSKLSPGPDDDAVQLVNGKIRAPRVLHLEQYDRVPRLAVRLTRQNLMLRDQYQCQYCGKRPGPAELNLDHVMPRSRGGTDTWENLVVSCRPCNLKKGKKTPREAGMHLLRNPATPRLSHAALLLQGLVPPFAEWQPFLQAG
jgi:5-methylcytosine-specific restriction endonuclease McrA